MNKMHLLRRFVEEHKDGDKSCTLTPKEAQQLAMAAGHALGILDGVWEGVAGRKLTEAEKGLERSG